MALVQVEAPGDLVRAAQANLVVRDGFAAFYFHPFLDLEYLKQTVEGIQAAGYRFVNRLAVAASCGSRNAGRARPLL